METTGFTVGRIAIGLAAAGLALMGASGAVRAEDFLGFRLLDLDGNRVKWSAAVDGSRTMVTYAVIDKPMQFANARNCAGLLPVDALLRNSGIDRSLFEQEVEASFEMWSRVANIEFTRIGDAAKAGIVIGAQERPEGHAYANVDYRPGAGQARDIDRSLICLNPEKHWKVGFGGSLAVYDLRYTIAHEIGHAIGLDHPDSASQIMSFAYRESHRTLQAGDVEGVVRLYGAPQSPGSIVSARRPESVATQRRPGPSGRSPLERSLAQ